MRFLSVLCFIVTFVLFIFFVLLPTIGTWSAIFNSTVGGILFSIFLFWFAILAYPIALLIAGLATGIGGTASVIALVLGYVLIGINIGVYLLGGWLWSKADESKEQKEWIRDQMKYNRRNLASPVYSSQVSVLDQPRNSTEINQGSLSSPQVINLETPYVGNMKTRTLHIVNCSQIGQFDTTKYQLFYTLNDAMTQGYKPCKLCKPELYIYKKSFYQT